MKKITLTSIVFFLFFMSSFGQQLDDGDILTISFSDDYDENNLNPNSTPDTFDINEFLVWGNNGVDLNSNAPSVIVNLSSDLTSQLTTNVSYTTLQRTWKVIGVGDAIPKVTIKIPRESIIQNASLGSYYMFISNSEVFDYTADSRVMTLDGNGNLETEYNFEGTTYITFGFAPEVTEKRSLYFDGSDDYIDMQNTLDLNPTGFTISAWVKRDATDTGTVSIVSKRDLIFTQGYDLTLNTDNRLRINWKNSGDQSLSSYTSIPDNEWHHVAVTYDGSRVSIYIDGVLDNSENRTAPVATNDSFHIAAAGGNSPTQHFKGHIDEVRIWKTDLTEDQLRFVMNQEITNASGHVIGKQLPTSITKNDINTIAWSDLTGYYPMSVFTYKNTVDESGNGNDGELKNLMTVDAETAPLPYTSIQHGNWNSGTSWTNGAVQYTPGSTSIVDPNITIDWNIVKASHNLIMDNSALPAVKDYNRTVLGLFVEANELTLEGNTETHSGNGITITHYLSLAGTIDLEGESQLIQSSDSDLDVTSSGKLERDQQGTADTFTYNYWSSPVSLENSGVNSFKVSDVMKDGTIASNPLPINFSSSGYNGASTYPIRIADYWIWKYANQPAQSYSAWQHVRRTGTIFPGEGFTMKGPGTGLIAALQNYVFVGKPNNGNINLTLVANNEYLVGNPYPSAIDANIFIRDNGNSQNSNPLISGTLYFWKHWGGGSHLLQEYQGGYATYNFSGSVAAASKGISNPDFGTNDIQTKKPRRYIPVGQGFFVLGENGGTINFNNGQRVFKKEGIGSVFMRNTTTATSQSYAEIEEEDDRMKFRIGFNSVNTIRRQLLLTIDENSSPDVDWAYDGKLNESQIDDMFWIINNEEYIIQGSNEAEVSTIYPLGIKTNSDGLNSITIDALENVPMDINIYVHDIALNLYHDLRASDYEIFLNAGEYLNRFEITFSTGADLLGIEDNFKNSIDVLYSTDIEKLVLINPNQIEVKSIVLFNMLGQPIYTYKDIIKSDHSEYNVMNLSAGAYIIKLYAANDSVLTKKIVVE